MNRNGIPQPVVDATGQCDGVAAVDPLQGGRGMGQNLDVNASRVHGSKSLLAEIMQAPGRRVAAIGLHAREASFQLGIEIMLFDRNHRVWGCF